MSSAPAATTSAANGGSPAPAPNDAPVTNGNHVATTATGVPALGTQEPRPPPAPPSSVTPNSKKAGAGKSKKPIDSTETSKLLATRIAQLEHDQAGDKDQAAEIGAFLLPSDSKVLLKVVMMIMLEMGCGSIFFDVGSKAGRGACRVV